MVRRIYVSRNKEYNIPETKITKLGECDEISDCFDDFTGNFEDLNIWNTDAQLHGQRISDVKIVIQNIINTMKEKGFEIDYEECENKSCCENGTLSGWFFGHTERPIGKQRVFMFGIDYFNLPDDERIKCLVYHLQSILNIVDEYDPSYYLFSNTHH